MFCTGIGSAGAGAGGDGAGGYGAGGLDIAIDLTAFILAIRLSLLYFANI